MEMSSVFLMSSSVNEKSDLFLENFPENQNFFDIDSYREVRL
jgi:hypothetical protein